MRKTASPLRNLRRARTMTQADLARVVRVSQQTIAKIERGLYTPPADLQVRLAAVLGVAVDVLFPVNDEPRSVVA